MEFGGRHSDTEFVPNDFAATEALCTEFSRHRLPDSPHSLEYGSALVCNSGPLKQPPSTVGFGTNTAGSDVWLPCQNDMTPMTRSPPSNNFNAAPTTPVKTELNTHDTELAMHDRVYYDFCQELELPNLDTSVSDPLGSSLCSSVHSSTSSMDPPGLDYDWPPSLAVDPAFQDDVPTLKSCQRGILPKAELQNNCYDASPRAPLAPASAPASTMRTPATQAPEAPASAASTSATNASAIHTTAIALPPTSGSCLDPQSIRHHSLQGAAGSTSTDEDTNGESEVDGDGGDNEEDEDYVDSHASASAATPALKRHTKNLPAFGSTHLSPDENPGLGICMGLPAHMYNSEQPSHMAGSNYPFTIPSGYGKEDPSVLQIQDRDSNHVDNFYQSPNYYGYVPQAPITSSPSFANPMMEEYCNFGARPAGSFTADIPEYARMIYPASSTYYSSEFYGHSSNNNLSRHRHRRREPPRNRSINKMPLVRMYALMGLDDDHTKAKLREERIISLVKAAGFNVGHQAWIRDTDEAERERIIKAVNSQIREFGYDDQLLEIIVRRGTYSRMQSKLRQRRRVERRDVDIEAELLDSLDSMDSQGAYM